MSFGGELFFGPLRRCKGGLPTDRRDVVARRRWASGRLEKGGSKTRHSTVKREFQVHAL